MSKLRDEIKEAIESGEDTDWVYNGEDEVAIDTFNSEQATNTVMEILKNKNPFAGFSTQELEILRPALFAFSKHCHERYYLAYEERASALLKEVHMERLNRPLYDENDTKRPD